MTLADTSAIIALLRDKTGNVRQRMTRIMQGGGKAAIIPHTRMEILAGARGPEHCGTLENYLHEWEIVPPALDDFDEAAIIYAELRWRGITISGSPDCLVAQVALVRDIPLIHCDRDFEFIAQVRPRLRQIRLPTD